MNAPTPDQRRAAIKERAEKVADAIDRLDANALYDAEADLITEQFADMVPESELTAAEQRLSAAEDEIGLQAKSADNFKEQLAACEKDRHALKDKLTVLMESELCLKEQLEKVTAERDALKAEHGLKPGQPGDLDSLRIERSQHD